MISTRVFGDELINLDFNFYCGVPCSFLSDLINYVINYSSYIAAGNEGDAVAICSGAALSGKKAVVIMQNSGLTNASSPLTSLNYPFELPVLGFVSLRGEPGTSDEPQHQLMGTITESMLDLMNIEWEYLDQDTESAKRQLHRAKQAIDSNKTFFFIVKKGIFNEVALENKAVRATTNESLVKRTGEDEFPARVEVLKKLCEIKSSDTIFLTSTGKVSRELYEIEDSNNNFYMVGSMGCVSAIGLGVSLNTENRVIAIDGDGALIMRMGNLASNGFYGPNNLLHLVIDNNSYDSTGGQRTISNNIDFVQVAASVGYRSSVYAHSLSELEKIVIMWQQYPKLTFVHIRIKDQVRHNLGRPKIKPFEVKDRLMSFIRN